MGVLDGLGEEFSRGSLTQCTGADHQIQAIRTSLGLHHQDGVLGMRRTTGIGLPIAVSMSSVDTAAASDKIIWSNA